MKTNDFLRLAIIKKTMDYQKDPNPDNWATIKGAKVHLENGKIDGGAGGKFTGKSYTGSKKQAHVGKYDAWNKTEEKPKTKPEVGDKGMAFLKRMSSVNSSSEEETGYMARDIADQLRNGKSLKEIRDYFYKNIDKHGIDKQREKIDVDNFIEAVKRADKGLDPWGKNSVSKTPKKKTNSASTEQRNAIVDKVMKNSFVSNKVEETSKKLIEEANKRYGGDHEVDNVLLENVVKEKDGAYVTLKIVAKDKTGKSKFPQTHSLTFKVNNLSKEQKTSTPKPAGNKVVRVKLSNGVTLRWQAVPGEPDKVYNPETHEMYDFKGGLKAALEKAKSQGAEIEEYEETPSDPYANETTSRETRRGARGAAATRRASKRGRPPGAR